MVATRIPFSQCKPSKMFADILQWCAMENYHRWLCICTAKRNEKSLKEKWEIGISGSGHLLTLRITRTSVKRSMQQIFRSYATRSRAGLVELIRTYFFCSDLIAGLLKLRSPNTFPIDPNTLINEPDDVPIGKPLSSSCCNVWISLKWTTVVKAVFSEL